MSHFEILFEIDVEGVAFVAKYVAKVVRDGGRLRSSKICKVRSKFVQRQNIRVRDVRAYLRVGDSELAPGSLIPSCPAGSPRLSPIKRAQDSTNSCISYSDANSNFCWGMGLNSLVTEYSKNKVRT